MLPVTDRAVGSSKPEDCTFCRSAAGSAEPAGTAAAAGSDLLS